MDIHEIDCTIEAHWQKIVKLNQKYERLEMNKRLNQILVLLMKEQYIDARFNVLLPIEDLPKGPTSLFLQALELTKEHNIKERLLTHSMILNRWLRLGGERYGLRWKDVDE